MDPIAERLNRIQNKNNEEKDKEQNKENNNEEEIEGNKSLDLNKLKDKIKMDNAPELKDMKNLDKEIKNTLNEIQQAEKDQSTISKEQFLKFIEKANETHQNYEKQLQYYSMYGGKYNTKDLTMCSCIGNTDINERNFYILSDKKHLFENELNKLNIDQKNPDVEEIKKIYQEKLDALFNENSNLNKIMEKMSNEVVGNLQLKIKDLFSENKEIKIKNQELKSKLLSVEFLFNENSKFTEQMKNKDNEIIQLNKQQIIFMNKFEKSTQEIKKLNQTIKINRENILERERKFNEKCIEVKKLESTIEDKNNVIATRDSTITEQEKKIKLLFDDNVEWEKKFNEQVKENERFKKWVNWDQDLVNNFRKIEKLTEELTDAKIKLDKIEKENKTVKESNENLIKDLKEKKESESKLKLENEELLVIKKKHDELEIKLKDYLETKQQNETYRKDLKAMKDEYDVRIINIKNTHNKEIEKLNQENENKINLLKSQHESSLNVIKETNQKAIDKLNDEIKNLKDEISINKMEIDKRDKKISDITGEFEKKSQLLDNLKESYDNIINKIKVQEEKLQQYEKKNNKNKSAFSDEFTEDEENKEKKNENNNGENNNINTTPENKTYSTYDKFAFTREVLNDYLYCLYLFETGISIQSIISNIMGNLSTYSSYSFKNSKSNNNISSGNSNYPVMCIQNEFIEDLYFVAFDKLIAKKFLFEKDKIIKDGKIDKSILKINFEDFDQGTISEICLELINKNVITRLKSPKTLEQLSQLFGSKYAKKFDFEGKLSDFLIKDIVPVVKKRISRYNKSIIDEMRTLVELSLHNIHDGKIMIDNEEVYSFEKFLDQYNNYTEITERNIKIEIENASLDSNEALDNIKHTLKFYYPRIIRLDNCFRNFENNKKDALIDTNYLNKILASINYYQPNLSQFSLINNKIDAVFNKTILCCIKLLKNIIMLDLSNNGLNEESIKGLLEVIKQNKTIKILYLNENNITSACGYYLADALKKNTTIEILHLSHNKLNESGFESFLNILSNDNNTLKELDISYNDLKTQDFKYLSNYLNSDPPIKSLDISGNKLDPQSANLIGVTLKKLKNLEEFKVNNCNITDESAQNIIINLNESNIHNLELDYNNLGQMGPLFVLNKIKASNNLKNVSFQGIEMNKMFVDMIIPTLMTNKSIEKVNLKKNQINAEDLKKFVDASATMKNIKIIFSRDKVPDNASEILAGNKCIVLQ